jgi:hypothetical protein
LPSLKKRTLSLSHVIIQEQEIKAGHLLDMKALETETT